MLLRSKNSFSNTASSSSFVKPRRNPTAFASNIIERMVFLAKPKDLFKVFM